MKKKEIEIIKIAAKFQQELKKGTDRDCALMAAYFQKANLKMV